MPFEREQKSDNFGVFDGVEPEQTLLNPIDVFSGIEITSSFQNTLQGFTNADSDDRIALGMFYFEDENILSSNFPDIISNTLFRQIPITNLIRNGDCKNVSKVIHNLNNQILESSGLDISFTPQIIKPQGGWGYLALDGIKNPQNINTPRDESFIPFFLQSGEENSELTNSPTNPVGFSYHHLYPSSDVGYGGFLAYLALPGGYSIPTTIGSQNLLQDYPNLEEKLVKCNLNTLLGPNEGNDLYDSQFGNVNHQGSGNYDQLVPPIAGWIKTPIALSNNKCLVFDSVNYWTQEAATQWSELGLLDTGPPNQMPIYPFGFPVYSTGFSDTDTVEFYINPFESLGTPLLDPFGVTVDNHYRTLNQYQTILSSQDSANNKPINPFTRMKVKFQMLTIQLENQSPDEDGGGDIAILPPDFPDDPGDSSFEYPPSTVQTPWIEAGIISEKSPDQLQTVQGVAVGGYLDDSKIQVRLNEIIASWTMTNYPAGNPYGLPYGFNKILFYNPSDYGSADQQPQGPQPIFDFYHPNGKVFKVDMTEGLDGNFNSNGLPTDEASKSILEQRGLVRSNLGDSGGIYVFRDDFDGYGEDSMESRKQRGAFLMYVGSDKSRFPNMRDLHQKDFLVVYYDPFDTPGEHPYWVYDDGKPYGEDSDFTDADFNNVSNFWANQTIGGNPLDFMSNSTTDGAFKDMKNTNQFQPNEDDCIIAKLVVNDYDANLGSGFNLVGGSQMTKQDSQIYTNVGDPGNLSPLLPTTYESEDILLQELGVDDYGNLSESLFLEYFRALNYDDTQSSNYPGQDNGSLPYPPDHLDYLYECIQIVADYLQPVNDGDYNFLLYILLDPSAVPGALFSWPGGTPGDPGDFLRLLVLYYLGMPITNAYLFGGDISTLNKPNFFKPIGNFNSSRYLNPNSEPRQTLENQPFNFSAMNKFRNTNVGIWEEKEFSFNLEGENVSDLHFFIQAGYGWKYNQGRNRVYMDNFEVYEMHDFVPDCDVRKKKSSGDFGISDLTKYYDKKLQTEEFNDTTAPLEAQFYFYPRYPSDDVFQPRTPVYQDFKKGLFYLYDVDWGDGTVKEFTTEPTMIDEETSLYHTYEKSGIFEVTGYMLRMKPDFNDEPIGIIHSEKFKLRINVNEALDEDFTYFGSDGFSFIPFKNTLPVIGGYSKQSSYFKSIERQLGFIDDNTRTFVKFKKPSDKLKTEKALLNMDLTRESDFEILPPYQIPRSNVEQTIQPDTDNPLFTSPEYLATLPFPQYFEEFDINGNGIINSSVDLPGWINQRPDIATILTQLVVGNSLMDNSAIENSGYIYPDYIYEWSDPEDIPFGYGLEQPPENFYPTPITIPSEQVTTGLSKIKEELGKSIGDSDVTSIKYFNTPKSIWEMFGFENGDLNLIGKPDEPRYWKNIIPKDYSIFNRDGVTLYKVTPPFETFTLNAFLGGASSFGQNETWLGESISVNGGNIFPPGFWNFISNGYTDYILTPQSSTPIVNTYVSQNGVVFPNPNDPTPNFPYLADNLIYWNLPNTDIDNLNSLLGLDGYMVSAVVGEGVASQLLPNGVWVGSASTLQTGKYYMLISDIPIGEQVPIDLPTENFTFKYSDNIPATITQTITGSQQEWIGENEHGNTYYYPVLPRYGKDGKFIENNYPNNNIPFEQNGSITNNDESGNNIVVNLSSELIPAETNVLNDGSGNNNLGFSFLDYKVNFDNETSEPKRIKNTNKVKISTNNGAF